VLEEVGRTAAPVPALAVMGLGANALAHFGGEADLAESHLEGVADGSRIVTAALIEPLGDPFVPDTVAGADGHLTGEKVCVPAGLSADRIVVTADAGVFVVDPSSDGVTIERQDTTSGIPEARIVLEDAPAASLAGRDGVAWLVEHAQAASCVTVAGACAAALDLTANYTKSREQFGRPIASFQAVSQRAADAYISPSWYPSKHEQHRQVPTWNYMVAHAHGRVTVRDDERYLRGLVGRLTKRHEASHPDPWRMADSAPAFISEMVASIVGLEIGITRLVGKFKLGQNKEEHDVLGAADALKVQGHDAIADAMLMRLAERSDDAGS
jgi:predicted FMN-binding regulatory protein PaiB